MKTSNYEVTYILGESATEEQQQAVAQWFSKLIDKLQGSIEKTENWGKRELAYDIKRNRAGYYTTVWLSLPVQQVLTLEKELRFDERVIRSLVTKAYTSAQPGSLYPVSEEEQQSKTRRRKEDEQPATAEEELRRTGSKKVKLEDEADLLDEEDAEETRMKKLDQALDEIMSDESKQKAE